MEHCHRLSKEVVVFSSFAVFKSHLDTVTESYNILIWKGPTWIIKSNSWLHTGPSNIQTQCVVQMLLELCQLEATITALENLFHAHHHLVKNLSLAPTSPSPDTAPCPSLRPCCCHQRAELSASSPFLVRSCSCLQPSTESTVPLTSEPQAICSG